MYPYYRNNKSDFEHGLSKRVCGLLVAVSSVTAFFSGIVLAYYFL